jgi:diguanylate cyclase (GGDEF)-like protein/PAS domain S-box-containing protein
MNPTPQPGSARPVLIVWVFVGIVILLMGLTVYSSQLLASGRAFISAQGHWAKAQKDAVLYLTRYAMDRSEGNYEAFERALAVLDGDRRARNEIRKPDPDMGVVREGLMAGGVDKNEVKGLATLYSHVHGLGPLGYVATLWQRSDLHVDELRAIGERLRRDPAFDRAEAARQVHRVSQSLQPLEDDFAQTLGEVQRTAESFLTGGILIITGVLLIGGITVSRRFLLQNARLQQTLAEGESQMRHLVESAPLPLLIVRAADQRVLYANERALEQFALNFDSARGRSLADFHADPEARQRLIETVSRNGNVRDFEAHLRDVHGREFWVLLSAQPMRYAGAASLLVAMANIDDRKRAQDDMHRRAMHDPLTGLPNRAMFMEALERAVAKSRRRAARFSVLFVDLDHFKEVNDTMGHHAGDELLKAVSERLGAAVRQSDLVARLGGDEFVVLIEEHGGPEEVMIVAQKVLTMLTRPLLIDWREVQISGSIGIASFPEDGGDLDTLIKNADAAMYQAKERGRNNFQFYSAELNRLSHHRFEQEQRIRGALERDEFFLEYQPEFDFATGRVVAVEALLRWRDPVSGVVGPAQFMALAEESGTMAAIGRWVLDNALAAQRRWQDDGARSRMAINLSARQLQQPELATEFAALLQAHGVEASQVRFEITEPALMSDSEATHRTLRELRALGAELAIDDFGAGYSSLGLLRGLPVQVVKVDRSLVSACLSRRECAAIVQATAAMAHAMGLRVVAEGVESEEQRKAMQGLGCDGAQGNFLQRPGDYEALRAVMARAVAEQIFTA